MTRFAQFADVKIATARFTEIGVPEGSSAVVLDVYPDGGYEMQAFNENGETIGLFSARGEDLAIPEG